MTHDRLVTADYDPASRFFRGNTAFAPHPSSLLTEGELVWPTVYVPRIAEPVLDDHPSEPPAAMPSAAAVVPEPASAWAASDLASVVETPRTADLEPYLPNRPHLLDAIPSARSPHPTFEPLTSPDGPAALPDHSAFRVPAPVKASEQSKFSTLYRSLDPPAAPVRPKSRAPRWLSRPVVWAIGAVAFVVVALSITVLPKLLSTPETLSGVFTAPMLVLRAVGAGQVSNVAVNIGQAVEPATVLLTIHVNPPADASMDDLKARLQQARARQAAPDDPAAPPAARHLKETAAADVDRLQKAIAGANATPAPDQPVTAGVHGVVWSLDAQAGGQLQAGDPLAQLADCGRAFLVVRNGASGLKAGQTVLIRMPGMRPFHGTVRPSAGVAEPAKTLVIEPTGFAAVAANACPVGVSAEIQPETRT